MKPIYSFICNTTVAPFDNKLVRQAISCAIDRDFIVEAAAEGLDTPTSLMISPNMFGYPEDIKLYDYNTEKAKELLEEANVTLPPHSFNMARWTSPEIEYYYPSDKGQLSTRIGAFLEMI